jgi:hypothetical protein
MLTVGGTRDAGWGIEHDANWKPTVNVGGAVIVKCANPAFTKVEKEVNDFNYIKYPKYVRAYHS